MKSTFGSAPLSPPAPQQHPRTHSNPNAFIETYSAALQGWAEGSAHYEHQRPRWALTWSFEMIGVTHSVNKKLGRLCTPLILSTGLENSITKRFMAGKGGGMYCEDLKEMGHHFLPGCICSWRVVDQTPTCCPLSPGPYWRKLRLCFIEQHYCWVTEYSYNNFHVKLHVMLCLSALKCWSCLRQWPAVF